MNNLFKKFTGAATHTNFYNNANWETDSKGSWAHSPSSRRSSYKLLTLHKRTSFFRCVAYSLGKLLSFSASLHLSYLCFLNFYNFIDHKQNCLKESLYQLELLCYIKKTVLMMQMKSVVHKERQNKITDLSDKCIICSCLTA